MSRKPHLILLVAVLLFVVLRYPLLENHPGIQDEQWFAIPGYTMWTEGVPRIPYLPSRIRSSFFENADVCMMALPPGLAFAQAPFFAVFEPGYPTARLPVFLAAIGTIIVAYLLARLLGLKERVAGGVAILIALSRPLLFAGLTSRPDALCIFFGILCSYWLSKQVLGLADASPSMRSKNMAVFFAGLFCGLAGLCHPLAIVFAMQSGVTLLFIGGGPKRIVIALCLFALGALLGIAPWLPYVLTYSYEFNSQFMANVLDRAGPGLFARLLWPFPSLVHHAGLLLALLGPAQLALLATAMIAGTIAVIRSRSLSHRSRLLVTFYAWSGLYFTATAAGRHPSQLYWLYAFVWCMIFGAVGVNAAIEWMREKYANRTKQALMGIGIAACIAVMMPGAGLRTWLTYVTHWKDARYNGQAFIAEVLSDIPKDAECCVDVSYVFDVYLSGRRRDFVPTAKACGATKKSSTTFY
ncbi:hypothetical protein C2E31_23745 [Rhodopirellula baltica]|nr:hypothetical protein C2E31_23745 [Rhodopirellula baltica]